MIDHIYINGRFHTAKKAKIPVNDRGFMYGDGVFETMRSHGGRVFMLHHHLERLFHSLRELRYTPGFDGGEVEDAVYRTMAKSSLSNRDAYIKVMVTRGEHGGDLGFTPGGRCSLVIMVKKLEPYPEWYYSRGVEVISSSIKRIALGYQLYRHKLMNYFENIYEKDRAGSRGAFESLFLTRDRLVLEGATTNIFAVKRSTVFTPPLTQNILPGITRKTVLQLCRTNRIKVWEKSIHYRDLIDAHEVFLTNSIAGIVPVRKIDAYGLSTEIPGSTTSRLTGLYRREIEKSQS
ncbi:hypothetical protein GF374_03580 [Candidatus Woesearchaeota archaeon]|nr:hypothetical protein [Candidatus Woesearchaeota archaeon]